MMFPSRMWGLALLATMLVLLALPGCQGEDDDESMSPDDGDLELVDGDRDLDFSDAEFDSEPEADSDLDGDADEAPLSDGDLEESGCIQDPERDLDPVEQDEPDGDVDSEIDADPDPQECDGTDSEMDDESDADPMEADSETEIEEENDPCPFTDMVLMGDDSCMDRYEASRSDATASSGGIQTGAAQNVAGVIPWTPVTLSQARGACQLAGKRLCGPAEWVSACRGKDLLIYTYGNTYDAAICNGIDTFCHCGAGSACEDEPVCPFPNCRQTCGAAFHVMPTGAFPDCHNLEGVMDLNGNVWEIVDLDDGYEHFRGGAYNCGDSETLHRCDYDATWGPSAKGFRCCADPSD